MGVSNKVAMSVFNYVFTVYTKQRLVHTNAGGIQ